MDLDNTTLSKRIERTVAALKPTCLKPENIDWSNGPDPQKFWIPEELTRLYNTNVYATITDEQALHYNQNYALRNTEEFIWLETFAIIRPIKRLLKGSIPTQALRTLLESFVEDEECHTSAGWKLLYHSRPELYQNYKFHFFKPPIKPVFFLGLTNKLPRVLSSWSLFIATLEEATIPISRMYKGADETCDPIFTEFYTRHALDEARHCKVDSIIADWLIGDQPQYLKSINGWILKSLMQAYFDPNWGTDSLIDQLVKDCPELKSLRMQISAANKNIREGDYANFYFSKHLSPLTARNAEKHPILDNAIRQTLSVSVR